jgi:hypothetical protein
MKNSPFRPIETLTIGLTIFDWHGVVDVMKAYLEQHRGAVPDLQLMAMARLAKQLPRSGREFNERLAGKN